MLATGTGVERDLVSAFRWYRKAAALENAEAAFNLAMMHLNGEGTRRSKKQALKLLATAARFGSVDAHEYLAELHLRASPSRPDKAALHYLRALSAGSIRAAALLGAALSSGQMSSTVLADALGRFSKVR